MALNSLEELKYLVLPGHNQDMLSRKFLDQWSQVYNIYFDTWKRSWEKTFKELRSTATPQPNDFLRQQVLAGLLYRDQMVGMLTNSFFDLRWKAHCDHPYFQFFPESFKSLSDGKGVHRVMTMEYLYVDPLWRKTLQNVSLSEILPCLALKRSYFTDVDAVVGVARSDRKIDTMLYNRGAECVGSNIEIHNVKVDLIYFPRQKLLETSLDQEEDRYVEYFWENRLDLSDTNPAQLIDTIKKENKI